MGYLEEGWGTWHFFGGADKAYGLLLPSLRLSPPQKSSWSPEWMFFLSKPASHLAVPCLSATGQCPEPHKLSELVPTSWSQTILPRSACSLPFFCWNILVSFHWASTVDSQRHLAHLNGAPWTWLLVWAMLILDYLLPKLQLNSSKLGVWIYHYF